MTHVIYSRPAEYELWFMGKLAGVGCSERYIAEWREGFRRLLTCGLVRVRVRP